MALKLRLRNRWQHQGKDWWQWDAFVDDDGSGDLGQVDHVDYILHPTFADPVRTVTDPSEGFKMSTAGWGTFDLTAVVYARDGKRQKLTHELQLESSPPSGVSK